MNNIENLKDLFIEQGKEMNDSYQQALRELPGIEKQAESKELKNMINEYVETTKKQQDRLKNALEKMNITHEGDKSIITETILNETERRIGHCKTADVRDACVVGALQQLGHKKVADLGAMAAYAEEIGQISAATLLRESFEEEKKIGKELIKLAQNSINRHAAGITA